MISLCGTYWWLYVAVAQVGKTMPVGLVIFQLPSFPGKPKNTSTSVDSTLRTSSAKQDKWAVKQWIAELQIISVPIHTLLILDPASSVSDYYFF
jgi:hypothetical protein